MAKCIPAESQRAAMTLASNLALLVVFMAANPGWSGAAVPGTTSVPQTVYWDGQRVATARSAALAKSERYKDVVKRLRKEANSALKHGPYSVMDKRDVAPSGDKHDYVSYARYWWPNPKTPDGLPYIRRDGRTNKEQLEKGDRAIIGKLYDDVEVLSIAAYVLDDKKYADHAAALLRSWFLDRATRMNPHMRYGQAIPGKNDGRGSGIIDTRHFIRLFDSIALLHEMGAWPEEDNAALTNWMKDYLHWLQNDPQGKNEHDADNNHGSWYDAQTAAIAMYVGERDVAREIVEGAKSKRIAQCIEPDGRQPAELERTRGLHYSVFDLAALSVLARIGEQVDVDLWNYETKDGRSIRGALNFITPYLAGESKWPYQQIKEEGTPSADMGLFYFAAARYHDPRYLSVVENERGNAEENDYVQLLFPAN